MEEIDDSYTRLKEYKGLEHDPWANFNIDGATTKNYKFELDSDKTTLFTPNSEHEDLYDFTVTIRSVLYHMPFYRNLKQSMDKMIKDLYKPPVEDDSSQQTFKSFFESYTEDDEFNYDFKYRIHINHVNEISFSSFEIKPEDWNNKTFHIVDFIDEIYPDLMNLFRCAISNYVENNLKSYPDLSSLWDIYKPKNMIQWNRVYAKYL